MNTEPATPDAPTGSAQRLVAITGATGFIGRHLVTQFARAGWRVRLLLRRDPVMSEWADVCPEIVAGSLRDRSALDRLVEGASAVIHLAGLIKAASKSEFFVVNRDGAAAVAGACREKAPGAHLVLVSSLAAREPQLSDYAASKHAGEDAARNAFGAPMTVLRPPAVYGPGDRETLVFFQLARNRIVPLLGSASARAAMIHVVDLCRLLVALAGAAPRDRTIVAADAHPEGYRWDEILGAAARAVGNPAPRFVRAPLALLRTVALAGDAGRLLGAANMLNSQKLRELRHEDWSAAPPELARIDGWAPLFDLDSGFSDAVRGYRDAGWLPR